LDLDPVLHVQTETCGGFLLLPFSLHFYGYAFMFFLQHLSNHFNTKGINIHAALHLLESDM